MAPSEKEMIQARIERMKALIDSLEAECSTSEEQHQRFLQLKRELVVLNEKLKPI